LNYLLDLINVLQDTTSQWRVLDLTINLREKNLQAGIEFIINTTCKGSFILLTRNEEPIF